MLIDELKEELLLDNEREEHLIEAHRDSNNKFSRFLPSLVKSARVINNKNEPGADFVGKVTRANFTTSAIMSALLLDKTILVVEPTNAIAEKTVNDAFALYTQIAGDTKKKYVRHLSSNRQGCSDVIRKNRENKALEKLRYTLSDTKCGGCEIGCYKPCKPTIPQSTEETCMIQTILKERLPLLKWNDPAKTARIDNIVEYLVGCGEKWAQEAKLEIKKMDDTVTISDGKRTATITIVVNDEKIKATLTTHDGRIYYPIVEEGKKGIEIYGRIKPDVITVTYDKLMLLFDWTKSDISERGKRFREIIQSADICLLDEISTFMQKLVEPMLWHEIKLEWNNGVKVPVLDVNMHTEIHRLRNQLKPCGIDYHDKGMVSIFDSYLIPFVDGMKTEIDKSTVVSSGYPDSFENPVDDKRKQLLEEETNNALHDALEFAITQPDVFGLSEDDCVFLDRMLELMSAEVLSVIKHEGKMGTRVTITPRTQERDIRNLQAAIRRLKYKGHLLLTDATLTVDEVENLIGFKVNVIHFNDPQNTNEKILVVNDTTGYKSFRGTFDRYKWDRDPTYCQDVIEKITSFAKYNPLIWCMNKKIAMEVVRELKAINVKAEILDENTPDTGFAVSWYGSSYARGMKNKRRFTILLSPAYKPNGCYAETVYCIPGVWNPFDSYDRNRAGAAYDQVHNPSYGIPIIYKGNAQCFVFIADSLQHNNMLADEVQALSRVKDPAGEKRSVALCLNWEEKRARELCQQGIYGRHDYLTGERYFEDSENLLPPVKFSRNAADIDKWLHGEDLDEYLDFERFADGIDRMLTANRLVVSREMAIAQLANNSNISVENARGALACLVNLNLHFNTFVQTRVSINNLDRMFTKDLTLTDRAVAYQNRRNNIGWLFAIESILRAIAESKKEEISLEELQRSVKKIVNPVGIDVDRVLDTMITWNIFGKSPWRTVYINEDKVCKRVVMKTNVDDIVLKALEKLAAEGINEIKAWRVHDITGLEVKVIETAFKRLWKHKVLMHGMKYNPGKKKGNKGGKYVPFIKVP